MRTPWVWFFSACCSALLTCGLVGQEARVDRIDHLSVQDGLSQITVRDLYQDRQGFLWIATSDGLNRYDGYDFKVYRHRADNAYSLAANEVMAILEDRQGVLWFGTRTAGLARFEKDQERFVPWRHDPQNANSLVDDRVLALLQDDVGALWIGTGGGLSRLNPSTGQFANFRHHPEDPHSLLDDWVLALEEDRHGKIWVGAQGGLSRFDPVTKTFEQFTYDPEDPMGLGEGAVEALFEDREGRLWIGTASGLYRVDEATGGFVAYRKDPTDPTSLPDDHVVDLLEDRSGVLWVATKGGGLSWMDRESGSFYHYQNNPEDPRSLSSNSLLSITEDREGILWVGSYVGIDKIDRRRLQFSTWRHVPGAADTLASNSIWPILEDRDGVLWVGTYDRGLHRIDRTTWDMTHFAPEESEPKSLPHGTVSSFYEDEAGRFWVGTREGLSQLDRETGEFTDPWHDPNRLNPLLRRMVFTMLEDRAGRFWLGMMGGGLVLFDRETFEPTAYLHDAADSTTLSQSFIHAIVEDQEGMLWVGTLNAGVNKFDPATGRAVRLSHDPGNPRSLGGNRGAVIHQDRSGSMWIGTQGGGLSRYLGEEEGFKTWSVEDGLPSGSVLGILESDSGEFWLSTFNGLSRFDPRSETFHNFGVADGLQGESFSPASFFQSARGEMFFGGTQGLNVFYPEEVQVNSEAPTVVLTGFRLFDEPVTLRSGLANPVLKRSITEAEELVLSHQEYVFSLQFAALHFASPEENRFAYRLEGFDREWIEVGAKERIARYSNLPPGNYTFRVKAASNHGVWNEEGVGLRIVQLPAPWHTWWARTLYALVFCAGVLAFVRWQQRRVDTERAMNAQLREVDRMKDEFLANTSHELRTPLYGITGITESLIDGVAGELSEEVKDNLSMVVASSERLGNLVDDILDSAKIRSSGLALRRAPLHLHSLTDVVLTLAKPLVGSKRLALLNAVPSGLVPAFGDERRVQQILHNLVVNAIKFTEEGEVKVQAWEEKDHLVVSVEDTGVGIAEEHQKEIFGSFIQADASTERVFGGTGLGLSICKQLVELQEGKIWVDSKLGEGSHFRFTLPKAREKAALRKALARPRKTTPQVFVQPTLGDTGQVVEAHENGFHILVVDDEPVIRQVIANHLRAEGYRFLISSSGGEALRLLEEEQVDLVLLDIMMPRMSGYEVCRRIRKKYTLEELPVLFLSAKKQAADLAAGFEEGGNDYLTKPVTKSELLSRLNTHLQLLTLHRQQLDEVKTLRGLLPICAGCKRVRDDEGFWKEIETYLDENSEAQLSHGLCPHCIGEYYDAIENLSPNSNTPTT